MPRHFPHLLKEDKELWIDFLRSDHNIYDRYEYDIKVGYGRDPGPDFPIYIREMAVNISRRRIDAIAFLPNAITIIEISIFAGLTQLGQLIAYPCLYKQTTPLNLPLKTLLIARAIQTDIEPVLIERKMPFLLYPFAELTNSLTRHLSP